MATIKKFEEIEAWQLARKLSKEVFDISIDSALLKEFKLRDQINAASGSVMDNIAEGFERGGKSELIQFLSIAKASNGEVKSQLYRIFDHNYINKEKFEELYQLANEIGNKLGAWINYLNDSEIKGLKFKNRV